MPIQFGPVEQLTQVKADGPVWRDAEFAKLWTADVVSALGSSITTLAVPLIAVESLHATPSQMGVLRASSTAAFVVLGLAAGVIVDRVPRRQVLVWTSALSALVIAAIPLSAVTQQLSMPLLYLVMCAAGASLVIDEVAFQSFLPRVAGRHRIFEANAWVRTTGAAADVVGPSAAGLLISLVTAPFAIVVDAASFVAASVLTWLVRVDEPSGGPARSLRQLGDDVTAGLRFVWRHPTLRAITVCGGVHNICSNGAIGGLYVLYAHDTLGVSAAHLGFILAAGGPGALVGAVLATRYTRMVGTGNGLVQMQLLTAVGRACLPLAAASAHPVVVLVVGEAVLGFARSVWNTTQLALRQTITPDHLQGRMSASIRFMMWVATPAGALVGGFAATRIGMVPTLSVATAGTALAAWGLARIGEDVEPAALSVR